MSKDFEDELRQALRPVEPGEDFTQRVLLQIDAGQKKRTTHRATRFLKSRFQRPRFQWLSAALAASLVLVVVVRHEQQERREQEQGIEARRQVLEALRVTSDKLDLAWQVVKTQTEVDENAGV